MNVSWSWFAGFFQAEGYVSKVGTRKPLQLCQKQREPLDAIREFWLSEFPESTFPKVGGPYVSGVYELYAFACFLQVLVRLYPYLRGTKRERAWSWLDCTLPEEFRDFLEAHRAIDDEWIVGFWEGDGSIVSHNGYPAMTFTQKDVDLLSEVRDYLGLGELVSGGSGKPLRLWIYIGHTIPERVLDILKYVRTPYRCKQLQEVLGVEFPDEVAKLQEST